MNGAVPLEKEFWKQIRENGFEPPAEADLFALTEELFGYLGDSDPELRDTIAYETFANWLEQNRFSPEILRTYILRLIVNLQEGLGERETDSVFLRSFSALSLAEIVQYDGKHSFLDRDGIHDILVRALDYLESERDPRGYVHEKGWAHALAHTADLLYVLAEHPHVARAEHAAILDGIQAALVGETDWIYIHGEDDRLVRAALAVFARQTFDERDLRVWLESFSAEPTDWRGSFRDAARQAAYFNTKAFLRTLHFRLNLSEDLASREALIRACADALQSMKQF